MFAQKPEYGAGEPLNANVQPHGGSFWPNMSSVKPSSAGPACTQPAAAVENVATIQTEFGSVIGLPDMSALRV